MVLQKNQVWKITFFHTNKPKNSSRLENDQIFFHTFPDSVGILHTFALLAHIPSVILPECRTSVVVR